MNLETLTSINQTSKNPRTTSAKYAFIPTTKALSVLADHGWSPVSARQGRVTNPENEGYQRHVVKLRNESLGGIADVGDVIPEIVLVNAHDCTSAFQLMVGLHEKVCSNGLVVAHELAAFRIAHFGYADARMAEALEGLTGFIPEVLGVREWWQGITLDRSQQIAFAEEAARMRFPDRPERVAPSSLLQTRHTGQARPTLWNTFNVVQEAVIRGGVRSTGSDGKRRHTRPVRGIAEDIRLNRALWLLADQTAHAMQG
jgi:hypothetical protein